MQQYLQVRLKKRMQVETWKEGETRDDQIQTVTEPCKDARHKGRRFQGRRRHRGRCKTTRHNTHTIEKLDTR